MSQYSCKSCLPVSKYGLCKYSFEIGPMDDTSEVVAIVGIEYSSVGYNEVFHRQEDVEALLSEKDNEITALKERNHRLLMRIEELERSMCRLRADYAGSMFRISDFVDEGNPVLWMNTRKYWLSKLKELV